MNHAHRQVPTKKLVIFVLTQVSAMFLIYDDPIQPDQLRGGSKDSLNLCGIVVQNQVLHFWEPQAS